MTDTNRTPDLGSAAEHVAWLTNEANRLLEAAKASQLPTGGFGWLDDNCRPVAGEPLKAWINTRMTHVLALGAIRGDQDCEAGISNGVAVLQSTFKDHDFGGWFSSPDPSSGLDKRAYEHAFVMLAASSAVAAGNEAANQLLKDACNVFLNHFWDDHNGWCRDVWSRDWTTAEPYLGANANMHTVEALIAVADATTDQDWLLRALRICDWFINRHARVNGWRIPEHFSYTGDLDLGYNANDKAHQFRPYGSTVGHGFEWARLLLSLEAALSTNSGQHDEPTTTAAAADTSWLLEASSELFARAESDGWARNGNDGYLYTTDWDGSPVVTDRLHWVVCEAIAAASALADRTSEKKYVDIYFRNWAYANEHLIDLKRGSWIAELDPSNRPSSSVWSGKPDVYHAYQACLIPLLGYQGSLAQLSLARAAKAKGEK